MPLKAQVLLRLVSLEGGGAGSSGHAQVFACKATRVLAAGPALSTGAMSTHRLGEQPPHCMSPKAISLLS